MFQNVAPSRTKYLSSLDECFDVPEKAGPRMISPSQDWKPVKDLRVENNGHSLIVTSDMLLGSAKHRIVEIQFCLDCMQPPHDVRGVTGKPKFRHPHVRVKHGRTRTVVEVLRAHHTESRRVQVEGPTFSLVGRKIPAHVQTNSVSDSFLSDNKRALAKLLCSLRLGYIKLIGDDGFPEFYDIAAWLR